jgi:hypothetical protein
MNVFLSALIRLSNKNPVYSKGWDPHYAAVARAHFLLAVHWFQKQ